MEFNISGLLISLAQDLNRNRSFENREDTDIPSPQDMEILLKQNQAQVNNNNWQIINETEDTDYPVIEDGKFLLKDFLVKIIAIDWK